MSDHLLASTLPWHLAFQVLDHREEPWASLSALQPDLHASDAGSSKSRSASRLISSHPLVTGSPALSYPGNNLTLGPSLTP